MRKIKQKLNVSLELYAAEDLQDVRVHPVIEDVMDNLDDGYKRFLKSLKSAQLREITKIKPIILWDDGAGNLTVIGNVMYYYESLANNAAVYVQKWIMTEKRALYNAIEEALISPMIMFSLLGPSIKIYKGDKNSGKYITLRGVTKCHAKFFYGLSGHFTQFDQRIYTYELEDALSLATSLHCSPETMYKRFALLGIRPRTKQRNPRPPLNPQRKLGLEYKYENN